MMYVDLYSIGADSLVPTHPMTSPLRFSRTGDGLVIERPLRGMKETFEGPDDLYVRISASKVFMGLDVMHGMVGCMPIPYIYPVWDCLHMILPTVQTKGKIYGRYVIVEKRWVGTYWSYENVLGHSLETAISWLQLVGKRERVVDVDR